MSVYYPVVTNCYVDYDGENHQGFVTSLGRVFQSPTHSGLEEELYAHIEREHGVHTFYIDGECDLKRLV